MWVGEDASYTGRSLSLPLSMSLPVGESDRVRTVSGLARALMVDSSRNG